MTDKQHQFTAVTSGALAVTGVVLLIIWAISLYSYGIWVDEHASVGNGRPIDYILFTAGASLVCAAVVIQVIRRRGQRES